MINKLNTVSYFHRSAVYSPNKIRSGWTLNKGTGNNQIAVQKDCGGVGFKALIKSDFPYNGWNFKVISPSTGITTGSNYKDNQAVLYSDVVYVSSTKAMPISYQWTGWKGAKDDAVYLNSYDSSLKVTELNTASSSGTVNLTYPANAVGFREPIITMKINGDHSLATTPNLNFDLTINGSTKRFSRRGLGPGDTVRIDVSSFTKGFSVPYQMVRMVLAFSY